MFQTRIGVRDIFAVLAVLLLACILLWAPWQSRTDGVFLVVTTPEGSAEYALSEDRIIQVESQMVTLTVVIEKGEVYVQDSNCRDRVCINSGRISNGGEVILCAPAGVRLWIKGGESDVDYVAG